MLRAILLATLVLVGTAGLAWGITRGWPSSDQLRRYQELQAARRDFVTVLMAKSDLPEGTTIRLNDLVSMDLPADYVDDNVLLDSSAVVHRVTTSRILELELIRSERLAR